MTKKEIQQYVYNFLYEKKIPHKTICAIMGNIQGENSAWKIDGVEVGGFGGYGLCQWTDTKYSNRKTQLFAYGTDLKHQCEFLYSELTGKNTDKTGADFQWISNPSDNVDGGEGFTCDNKRFLKGTDDIDFLTKAFCYCWERPAYSTNHLTTTRIPFANECDDIFTYTGNRNDAENYDKNNTDALTYDGKKATAKDYEITNKIENAVKYAIKIAKDDTHGYNQAKRWSGIDFDCSSLVTTAFQQSGFKIREYAKDRNITTSNLKNAFLSQGFIVVDTKKYMRGDILLVENEHVIIYIGDGKIVEASQDERGQYTGGQEGDQTGKEIYVHNYYSWDWICIRNPHIVYGTNNGNGVDNSTNQDSTIKNEVTGEIDSGTETTANGTLWKKLKTTPYKRGQLSDEEKKRVKNIDFGDYVKMIFTFTRNKEYVGTSYTGARIKFDTLKYKVVDLTAKGFVIIKPNSGLEKYINPKYIKKVREKSD